MLQVLFVSVQFQRRQGAEFKSGLKSQSTLLSLSFLGFTATSVRDNLSLMVFITSGGSHRKKKQLLSLLSLQEISAMLGRTESLHSNLPFP